MRMNARSYTLVNYGYALIKVIVGFLPCSLVFGTLCLVPLWICLLLPFSVAGMKLAVAGFNLWDYERRGNAFNENKLGKLGLGASPRCCWPWPMACRRLESPCRYRLPQP